MNLARSLFSDGDAFSMIELRKKQIAQEIDGFDRNRILNASVEDLCAYIEEKFRLDTPVLQDDQAVADQNEGMIEVYDRYRSSRYGDGPISVKGTIVDLSVPFTGDGGLFRVRPSSFDSMPPSGDVQGNVLVLKVSGADLQPDQVRQQLDRELASIKKYLEWLRGSTDPFNAGIRGMARQSIEARRQKLLAEQNLVASLGFALKKRADAPQTYTVPIKQRRIDPRPPAASTAPFKPEPALEEAEYKNVLDIMQNMALVLERNPTAFGSMEEEEDLRSHFLVPLNGQYEGQATDETFNFQGKTDILIRVEGKNIFIAECKIWRGEKSFTEAIDQLLSYLSWRDTKAAIVVFNRNKGFSNVLQKIRTASEAHPLCKSGPKIERETRFRYAFGQKDDPNREVTLTILAFDVPQAEARQAAGPRIRTV